ncbi:TonB-dependent receptor domain-containing protein [Sphingomonas sp. Leaf198]|uniref:TonB-dependent receptor domain-containing protein n=1 Tax=Sphingomonas sp. Leaf198 TaxID=1736299 RepID=UPI0009E9EA37|nr:TonB-dependent receptor [Sphingomonas sp. Leaf198]
MPAKRSFSEDFSRYHSVSHFVRGNLDYEATDWLTLRTRAAYMNYLTSDVQVNASRLNAQGDLTRFVLANHHGRQENTYLRETGVATFATGALKHELLFGAAQGEVSDDSSKGVFLPSASLLYRLTDRVSVYGSYSTSYHPNASVPAAGPVPASGPFAPEKGEGWEAGAKAEFLGGKLLTTAALFWIDKTNVLTTSDDVTSTVGSVRAQGGELTVSGQVTPAFNLTASYTYLDAKVRDDPTLGGNRFVNVPTDKGSIFGTYEIRSGALKGLAAGSGITASSRIAIDTANSAFPPSYATVDAVLRYRARLANGMVCRFLLEPGDTVLVDDPCYFNFLALLRTHRVKVVGVPMTPMGPDVAAFAAALAEHRPRFYLTNSAVHNPTGATLAAATAHKLLKLAEAHDLVVVEDDIFADFEHIVAPRLAAFDGLDRVIRIGSFSKSLSAAVRCGHIVARPDWIEALADLRIATSMSGNPLSADLLHGVLIVGSYRRHVETVRARLARAMARTAKRLRAVGIEPWIEPDAGIFLWARLPDGMDAVALARAALAEGIVLAPGNVFSTSGAWSDYLRFNVSMCDEEALFAFLAKACRAAAQG